jgi:hypothetical protein
MLDDVLDELRDALQVARLHLLIAWLKFRCSLTCWRIRFGVWLTIAWLTITIIPPLVLREALRRLRPSKSSDLSDEVPSARQAGV